MLAPKRKAAAQADTAAHPYSITIYAAAVLIALIAAEFRYVLFELLAVVTNEAQVAALGIVSFVILYLGLGILLAAAGRLPLWKALVFGLATPVLYIVIGGLLLALTNALSRPTGGLSTRAFSLAVIAATFLVILCVSIVLRGAPVRRSWLTLATLAVAALTLHIVFRLADNVISPGAFGGTPALLQRILPPAVNDLLIAVFTLKLFERTPRRSSLPADAVTKGASELITAWPPKPEPAAASPPPKPDSPDMQPG